MNWADAAISNYISFKEGISSARERQVGLADGAKGISNFWEELYSVGLRVLFCLYLIFIFPYVSFSSGFHICHFNRFVAQIHRLSTLSLTAASVPGASLSQVTVARISTWVTRMPRKLMSKPPFHHISHSGSTQSPKPQRWRCAGLLPASLPLSPHPVTPFLCPPLFSTLQHCPTSGPHSLPLGSL